MESEKSAGVGGSRHFSVVLSSKRGRFERGQGTGGRRFARGSALVDTELKSTDPSPLFMAKMCSSQWHRKADLELLSQRMSPNRSCGEMKRRSRFADNYRPSLRSASDTCGAARQPAPPARSSFFGDEVPVCTGAHLRSAAQRHLNFYFLPFPFYLKKDS